MKYSLALAKICTNKQINATVAQGEGKNLAHAIK